MLLTSSQNAMHNHALRQNLRSIGSKRCGVASPPVPPPPCVLATALFRARVVRRKRAPIPRRPFAARHFAARLRVPRRCCPPSAVGLRACVGRAAGAGGAAPCVAAFLFVFVCMYRRAL